MNSVHHSRKNLRYIIGVSSVILGIFVAGFLVASGFSKDAVSISTATIAPFKIVEALPQKGALKVSFDALQYERLKGASDVQQISLPLSMQEEVTLELDRFHIVSPNAQFYIASETGNRPLGAPDVILYRGKVSDSPLSHAYLSITSRGYVNGYVELDGGGTYFIAQKPGDDFAAIGQVTSGAELPPFVEICGVDGVDSKYVIDYIKTRGVTDTPAGARVAEIALEGDQRFVEIFGNAVDAENYMIQLLGAVSDIYLRDMNIKLMLSFLRVWPTGGEPFSAYDLYGFWDYWMIFENPSLYNIVHLVSGERGLDYGGVGYVDGTCNDWGFSISGFINGSFPTPLDLPNNSDWDVVVMAHEMGHNFGTLHTHDIDQYNPTIDDCPSGIPARSTIMSYCHIHPGYTSNTDLRFHSRVQQVIESGIVSSTNCYWFDCNDNGIDDVEDIALLTSDDENSNGIPDECEDCNNNGIIDDEDILTISSDVDGNGIPDECQADCNDNNIPDEYEIWVLETVDDLNGNNVPDECDPDCNGNAVADFYDISSEASNDYDHNGIPDECQDCNDNGIPDWQDMNRQFNLFVSSRNGYVREYHHVSGVPIRNLGVGILNDARDIAFGPDDLLYVANYGADNIVRIDVETGASEVFDEPGHGLDGPTSLAFSDDGKLYVCGQVNSDVLKYDAATGDYIETIVPPGSNGLNSPEGLAIGPNGNLFVTSDVSSVGEVFEFSIVDGSFVGKFVSSADNGGLSTPGGLAFKENGNLLVSSYNTHRVIEYDGTTGAYIGKFNDENELENPRGVRIGPNGDVYVVRTFDQYYQILEYVPDVGRYYRSFVRRDVGLVNSWGLAFKPGSANDADGNDILDVCEGGPSYLCGDTQTDGNINILDIVFIINYIYKSGPAPDPLAAANVDGVPGINILDIVYLINYIYKNGPEPNCQ